ncbi:MAG: hypothetical protein RLT05_06795 [Bauldia litoralis]
MKKTLIGFAAAAAILAGAAGAAQAAAPGPVDNGVVEAGFKKFGHRHNHLWKYDYRPQRVCKRHYRWTLTRFGWRNVYVGYWCERTNNY